MSEQLKTLPHSAEAERGIIGSILLDTTMGDDARVLDLCQARGLTPESFYEPRNRIFFETFREMSGTSVPIDAVTLTDRLRATGRLDQVGGVAAIQSLVDNTPISAHAEYYIDIVRQKHLLRTMIQRARETEERCFDEAQAANADILLGEVEKNFLEIGGASSVRMEWKTAVENTLQAMDRLFDGGAGQFDGLSTGFKYLDEKLMGLKGGDMIVVAARPSVGKTSLAMNMAECIAMGQDINGMPTRCDNGKRHPVLMFSLEMSTESLAKRMLAGRAGVWIGFTLGFAYAGQTSFPVLLSAVRHDGASASTNVYVYTNSPPGVRIVVPPPTMTGERDGVRIASQPPPREEAVTEGTRPLLLEKTDANGLSSLYWYVRPGDSPEVKCLGMEMSGGLFRTDLEYADGRTTESKPIAGGVAEMVLKYDAQRRETERGTGTETRTREYGLAGGVVRERIANADTGKFVEKTTEYDARFRPVSVGTAYCASPSRFTTLSWDDRRNIPSHVVTPEGRVSEWTTNGHDVVVHGAGTNDARAVTAILCDANDRPYAIVSPDGGRIDCAYDDRGYLSRIAAEDLPPVAMAHDALGRVSSMTLPGPCGDRVTSFTRNWRGKPLSVAYPDGTAESYAYEGNGTRIVRRVDALGREDAYQWTLGLPIRAGRVVAGVTNALFRVEHDEQLNVVAIIDPLGRNAETYVLDENERVVAVTNVEGQVLTRTYAVGDMVASETRFDGTAVSYAYDADANLASAAYPDETLAFTYDGDGLRTSASNSVGVVTNEYDAATGWLASSRGVDGTEVSYAYSDGGEVTGVVSVAGTTRYALDKAGRRTRIESPAGTMRLGYCAWNGKVAAVTNGNGMVTAYAYDVMDRVTNIAWTAANGTSLGGFSYAYDAAGRIVSRDHTLGNSSQPSQLSQSSHKSYAYDALDRLAADGDVDYTYDAAGNRMTRTENGETVAYALGVGDRLASYGRARSPSAPQSIDVCGAYSYDTAGCVTRIERDGRPALDLTWNGQYQLVSVSTNGVFAESYAYDALGRRVSTTTLEGAVRHVYDDSWQCLADIDENGNVLCSYVWGEGIDKLLAVKIGGNVYYPLTDIQGTVWGYVDSQNNVVARWTYDAWGNVLSEFCAIPSLTSVRYRFQGREWSAITGLINFRFRWYDPVIGRWISKDPIGLRGGLNMYGFCGNCPLIMNDPIGHFSVDKVRAWMNGFVDGIQDAVKDGELQKGLAATADGLIPFCDPFEDVYVDECGGVDDQYEVSRLGGAIGRECFLLAFLAPSGIARGGQQVVTHFSSTAQSSLQSGDWVMTGGNTFRNWLMAGGPDKLSVWKEALTTTVPKSSLRWPSGWEWVKGLWGQRVVR